MFEPVNGYQIRRELASWGVDDWAHLNPGSVYSVLATLTRHGHVHRHDLSDGARSVAVYTLTPAGRQEFDRLFTAAMTNVDPRAPLGFHTALSLAPLTTREQFVELLERRLHALDTTIADLETKRGSVDVSSVPPHVERFLRLALALAEAELTWVRAVLDEVRGGGLNFRDEPSTWVLATDDPGWQMIRDRERYQRMLES